MTISRLYLWATAVGVGIVALLYFFLFGDPKTDWVIHGGEPGGNYASGAESLAKVLNKANDWKVNVAVSSGSAENLEALAQGKADLAFVQNDTPGSEDVRGVARLYEEALHVLVREGNVTAVADLEGKIISVGQVGGGTEGVARATFTQLGIPIDFRRARRESLREGINSLRSGEVDAVCVVTGVGNTVVAEALSGGGLSLLNLGDNLAGALVHSYPFARGTIIPSGAYPVAPGKGLPKQDLPTIAVDVILACRANLDNADVLKLTKSIHEGRAPMARFHPLFAGISRPAMDGRLQFTLHEGARQHYDRNEPGFLQNWAEPMALLISVLAVAWGVGVALREFVQQRKKDSLDVYFEQLNAIMGELVKGPHPERVQAISDELHAIRSTTTQKLIIEQLAADESFVIFQGQLHSAQQLTSELFRAHKNTNQQ
jgi:TRAP transporter TAXI family solute receptor